MVQVKFLKSEEEVEKIATIKEILFDLTKKCNEKKKEIEKPFCFIKIKNKVTHSIEKIMNLNQ